MGARLQSLLSGRPELHAAELQPLSFVFPAPRPCNGQGLIGTMCEPGESPDPQGFSGNNVLKLLLGRRRGGTGRWWWLKGVGRELKSLPTDVRGAGPAPQPSFPGLAAGPGAGFPVQVGASLASQRIISFVLGQPPSEERLTLESARCAPAAGILCGSRNEMLSLAIGLHFWLVRSLEDELGIFSAASVSLLQSGFFFFFNKFFNYLAAWRALVLRTEAQLCFPI